MTETVQSLKSIPHSLEAERAVLGAVMLDNRAWDHVVDRLTVNDFYVPEHQSVFSGLEKLSARNQPFDVLTLAESLKAVGQLEAVGGEAFLYENVQKTPRAANV